MTADRRKGTTPLIVGKTYDPATGMKMTADRQDIVERLRSALDVAVQDLEIRTQQIDSLRAERDALRLEVAAKDAEIARLNELIADAQGESAC